MQAPKVSSSTSPDSKRAREKPFQCNICQKRYTNRAGLTVHVLTHARDGGLMSPLGKTSGDVTQQQVVVQGPYECRICTVRFMQKSPLLRHIGSDHSDSEKFKAAVTLGLLPASLSLPFPAGPTLSDEIFFKYNADFAPPRGSYSPAHAPAPTTPRLPMSPPANMTSPQPSSQARAYETEPPTSTSSSPSTAPTSLSWQHPPNTFDLKQSMAMAHNLASSSLATSSADKTLPVLPSDITNAAFPFYPLGPPNQNDLHNLLSTFRDRFMGNFMSHPPHPTSDVITNTAATATTNDNNDINKNLVASNPNAATSQLNVNTTPSAAQAVVTPRKNSSSGSPRGRPPGSTATPNDGKERPFECMFCKKRFTQRAGLNAHVLIHSGTKPFACSVCDKRFTQKSGLDQHFLTHTGERPHQCPMCDKRFTQKANLNNHILTHTGEKRHECAFCSRRFTQKANLNAHILTHTGEKPHQCIVCERKFTQKSGLNQHILTHTGTVPPHRGKQKRESTASTAADLNTSTVSIPPPIPDFFKL